MILSTPVPFTEAEQRLAAKPTLRTELNSAQMLEHVSPELRSVSVFSSRVINARLLQEFKDGAQKIVEGKSNYAQQRLRLKQLLASMRYRPELGTEGGLQDLSSNARLNLILRMTVSMVRGFSQWQQRNRPGELKAFPALELIRVSPRMKKRDWIERWNAARAALGDKTTATEAAGSEADDENGINAFALKNDPIWPAISRFGLPYEPFDFNSGMGTRAVPYEEALAVGVMQRDTPPIEPKPTRLQDGFEASLRGIDDDLMDVLKDDLSDEVEIRDGVLRFANEARNRCLVVHSLLSDYEGETDLSGVPPACAVRDRGAAVLAFLQETSCT